jgi:hypothetical protein
MRGEAPHLRYGVGHGCTNGRGRCIKEQGWNNLDSQGMWRLCKIRYDVVSCSMECAKISVHLLWYPDIWILHGVQSEWSNQACAFAMQRFEWIGGGEVFCVRTCGGCVGAMWMVPWRGVQDGGRRTTSSVVAVNVLGQWDGSVTHVMKRARSTHVTWPAENDWVIAWSNWISWGWTVYRGLTGCEL